MKKRSKSLLMTALICGTIVPAFCGGISAYAEEQTRSFDLPTILVEAEGKVVELPGGLDKVQLTPEPLAFITPLRTFHCTGCGGHKKNKLTKIEIKVSYE